MDEVFTTTLDGARLRVDVSALAAWESLAWLDWVALGSVAVFVVASMVLRPRGPRRALVWLIVPLTVLGGGLGAWFARPGWEHRRGDVLRLVPDLADRFWVAGYWAGVASAAACGLALAVAIDLAASWKGDARARQVGRASLALVLALACGGVWWRARPARARATELVALGDVPDLELREPIEAHPGQEVEVRVDAHALGMRVAPADGLLQLLTEEHIPSSRVASTRSDWARVGFNPPLSRWGVEAPLTVRSPEDAGAFWAPVLARRAGVSVESTLPGMVIEDAADPRFPVTPGLIREYRRLGPEREDRVTLRVRAAGAWRGFRRREIVVEQPPRDERVYVFGVAGHTRLGIHEDAGAFVTPAPIRMMGARDWPGRVDSGCRVAILGGLLCECVGEGEVGPRHCVDRERRELRLVSVDGEPVDVPPLHPPPPPRRRRRR